MSPLMLPSMASTDALAWAREQGAVALHAVPVPVGEA
jgi:hypothetical protein